MSIITISRGSFSGGKALAECLARKLNYRLVDREVIVERAAAMGVSQEELRNALTTPPTLLDRFVHKKYLYLTLIQAALAEEVKSGHAIYHGNAGHLLLKGAEPVLRVRIIAPMELRVSMCANRLRMEREEALVYIQKMDQDRRRWTQFLYGVDWGDPALYDIVLNLESLSIPDACEIVGEAASRRPCFEFGPACRAVIADLALATRVKASLALDPATSHLEFEVKARDGEVTISGRVTGADDRRAVELIAGETPGVSKVLISD